MAVIDEENSVNIVSRTKTLLLVNRHSQRVNSSYRTKWLVEFVLTRTNWIEEFVLPRTNWMGE